MSALPPKADMCSARVYVCFGPIADMEPFHPALTCGLSVEHVVSRQRAANALKCKIADLFNRYVLLDGHQDTRANQDLPGLGFVAKPGCNIGHCANRGIVKSAFKANRAECGKSMPLLVVSRKAWSLSSIFGLMSSANEGATNAALKIGRARAIVFIGDP